MNAEKVSNASQPVNYMPKAGNLNCYEFYMAATTETTEQTIAAQVSNSTTFFILTSSHIHLIKNIILLNQLKFNIKIMLSNRLSRHAAQFIDTRCIFV